MIVCGPSGVGKTTFIHKVLSNLESLGSQTFGKIIYAYGVFQPLYRQIAAIPHVEMVEGVPGDISASEDSATLLVLDDLFLETNKATASLFTRMRHMNLSTVFVSHNFFHDCKYMRTVTRNAHYLVFFRNPRDASQITHLSRQMFPGKPQFLPEAMKMATEMPYSYLFIDLKPETPDEIRVKSGILPEEEPTYYCPK